MKSAIFIVPILVLYFCLALNGFENYTEAQKDEDKLKNKNCLDSGSVQIKIIYDNNLADDNLKEAWGFSCLVTMPDRTILFDTGGDSSIFLANLNNMDIEAENVDTVVISHDHWDHNAGLKAFCHLNKHAEYYLLSTFSEATRAFAESAGVKINYADEPMEIVPGCFTTGSMDTKRENLFEHSLLISTDRGLIIITGCAHPGIIEIIEKCKSLVNDKILFVIGGFHLVESSREAISSIINKCLELNIKYMAPCHCTGEEARGMFKDALADKFIDIGVGTIINIKDLD